MDLQERDITKQKLTVKEIIELAERAGGMEQLVSPKRRGEVEGMGNAEIQHYLLEDPSRLRRPIIDMGEVLYLGFSKAVQEALAR